MEESGVPSYTYLMKRERQSLITNIRRLDDTSPEASTTTPSERLLMMWELTRTAWAFMGEPIDESRLQRHVVRVVRGEG